MHAFPGNTDHKEVLLLAYLLYFLIAIGATTVGALTGMGGGVIIKPLLDMLGGYDVETIGVLSSITVFAMSIVSVGRQVMQKTRIDLHVALPLAFGSVAGGLWGQEMLELIVGSAPKNQVTAVQNAMLAVLILCVFVYMCNKSRIHSLSIHGLIPALLVGVFLGVCSSFLGIGGGPINVALIIFLFGYDTKSAAVCSLITIFFAQISKLGSVALSTGFGGFDLSMLIVMVPGAIAGGFLGANLNKRLPEKAVDRAFNAVQILVLLLSVSNIVRSLL